jgi:hypothetical protein
LSNKNIPPGTYEFKYWMASQSWISEKRKYKIVVVKKYDPECATRRWKGLDNSKPVELDFKKKHTLKIPSTLEEDEKGVSYSDRCPAVC